MHQNRANSFSSNAREQHGSHARLRAALDSLDLDLEVEFVRYRQVKAGTYTSSINDWQSPLHPPSEIHTDQTEVDLTASVTQESSAQHLASENESSPILSLSHESISLPPFDLAEILNRSQQPESQVKALPAAQASEQSKFPHLNGSTDYFHSSEALRNGLTEVELEILRPRREKSSVNLRMAWGLGAIALLATGGLALLAYAQRSSVSPSAKTVTPPVASASPTPMTANSEIPNAANLAQVEFQNLSQASLSVLKPDELPLNPRASTVRVVVLRANPAILNRVQQIAPTAFLETSAQGARIQVGIFADIQRAKALVTTLQKEGLAAQIER